MKYNRPEEWKVLKEDVRRKSYGVLTGLFTASGITVTPSLHWVDRAIERNLSVKGIQDALTNPLLIEVPKKDGQGRMSKRYIGKTTTVAINPEDGVITTGYRTSKNVGRRLSDEDTT